MNGPRQTETRVTRPPHSRLRWLRRLTLAAVTLLVGLPVLGLVLEETARLRARSAHPPLGRLVSIGTHSLHLYCLGTGTPTVVFESDLDPLGALSWVHVHGKVADITRACAYDRAGVMWSEPGPKPRDGARVADELRALLQQAGEQGPFVLVGHAMGGAYARIFAGRYPDLVSGLVLVDAPHPDQVVRLWGDEQVSQAPSRGFRLVAATATRLGLRRLMKSPRPRSVPVEVYDAQQAYAPNSSMAWFDERVEREVTLRQSGQVTYLGGTPLTVLTAARQIVPGQPPPGLGEADAKRIRETWLVLQEELCSLSDDSEHRVLDAGHYVQFDQPEAVIEAVRDMVRRCREDT